jgi:DNA-directed RNA polymerase subunit M/transcription elongation factor TFIIS
MSITELELTSCLSNQEYDPSPHRTDPSEKPVSERGLLPIIYTCDNCFYQINLGLNDFKKHSKSSFTNLKTIDRELLANFMEKQVAKQESFIDFYCPKCEQPTSIFYVGGDSGYWGEFFFKILKVLVLKK